MGQMATQDFQQLRTKRFSMHMAIPEAFPLADHQIRDGHRDRDTGAIAAMSQEYRRRVDNPVIVKVGWAMDLSMELHLVRLVQKRGEMR